jgi:selenide,water dikinase
VSDPRLLVGSGTFDDAGVFQLSPELALVQSVDFFTPIVDDPFDFGRIAASNALSDLYAMGAEPLTALAVCAFPKGTLPLEVLRATLAGGLETLRREGVVPLGGHTVKGPEFTYGLAVTGTVHPREILTNAGGKVGDLLFLTKPLGTGLITTALKRGAAREEHVRAAVEAMVTTNRAAARVCREVGVHALTDVTGYGLLGHALEMAAASGTALEIEAGGQLPLLPGVREAALAQAIPGGLLANREWVASRLSWDAVEPVFIDVLCDPQTSGGLLAAVPPDRAEAFSLACVAGGTKAWRVGRLVAGEPGTGRVVQGEQRG